MGVRTPQPMATQWRLRQKTILAVFVVATVAVGSYFFLLKPPADVGEVELGPVTVLEPIQLNLAAGRYLKIGVALQGTAEVAEELDGTKALDSIVELFSGQTVQRLGKAEYRLGLKEQLLEELRDRYDGEVAAVYFTDFVTQ